MNKNFVTRSKEFSVLTKLKGPIAVALDLTTKCNLKCVHCFNDSGIKEENNNDMNDEEIINVAKQIADMHPQSVCLCGGETLCRENIYEIAEIIGKNVGSLNMVSNGFIMTDEKIKRLKKYNMRQVQISLDGINKFQHDTFRGVCGSFDRAVNAIKLLKKNNIEMISVSFVPNKLNYKDIEKYIDFCYELGVNNVRIMPFIPSGRGKTLGRALMLDEMEYFKLQRSIFRQKKKYEVKLNIEWGDPLDHMRRMPSNANIGLNTYCMEIKSNGELTVTTYLPIVVGNVKKHSLQEYWDRGYNKIWGNKDIIKQIDRIQNIYDFDNFTPRPYSGEKLYFEIIK